MLKRYFKKAVMSLTVSQINQRFQSKEFMILADI